MNPIGEESGPQLVSEDWLHVLFSGVNDPIEDYIIVSQAAVVSFVVSFINR